MGCVKKGFIMKRVNQILLIILALSRALFSFSEVIVVKSPDNKNEIRLSTGKELLLSVWRNGKVRISPTPIGLSVGGKGILGPDTRIIGRSSRTVDETFLTPIYKKAEVHVRGNEMAVMLSPGFQVRLHADNDGVAYRYETAWEGKIKVLDEIVSLSFPSPRLQAFVGYNSENRPDRRQDKLQNSWQPIYEKMQVSRIAADKTRLILLPLLLQYEDGVNLCVTESDLLDYPGWNLYRRGSDPARLSPWFARYPVQSNILRSSGYRRVRAREPWLAVTSGTRTFPWRVFLLADNPAKLVESDLVMALATPPKIKGDLSWIRPGNASWEWWNDWNVSGVDFRAGCNTQTYRYYVDFAARNKLDYLVMDEGWSVHQRVMEINPRVDLEGIIRYAEQKGVKIILWCSWPQLVGQQDQVFGKYAKLGVKGFKVDFMDRDDQFVVSFLEQTAAIAAKYHLVLDYHGMYKPTGIQRTYPNILNFEGVYGLEQMKVHAGTDFPANDCKIVFTRMVAGPLDYTPGAMRNMNQDQYHPSRRSPGSQGTRCHQMALFSIFEAPLQMLCDSPTLYMRNQECTDFIAKIPTVWDETVGLDGRVGEYAVIARRKGKDWYLSAITDWSPRKLTIDTSFLGEGTWEADVFADGINADRDATDYIHSKRKVTAGSLLTVDLKQGGGWSARISK